MSPDLGLLEDMLSAARLAIDFVAGMGESEFLADTKTQYAVVYCLTIIGEAAGRISLSTRNELPLPWADITGQRHVAVHDYRRIVMRRIWSTLQNDLPPLISTLEKYLA